MKPLFIPLKGEYYDAFERGDKNSEIRKFGKRWNANVCAIGRPVVLSRGYGKACRMYGVIRQVNIGSLGILSEIQKQSILKIYDDPTMIVIIIDINLSTDGKLRA